MSVSVGDTLLRRKTPQSAIEDLNKRFDAFERTQRGMELRQINKELLELPFRIYEHGTAPQTANTIVIPNQTRQQERITSIVALLDTTFTKATLTLDRDTVIPIPPGTAVFQLQDINFIVQAANRTLTWTGGGNTHTYGLFICGWAVPSSMKELS